ncbi:MAG: hypothetical protein JXR95_10930 [Deltaproteobacteria bacterium]|nr:hypothetical protein [Deltaproteobacteria bacterium]
MLAFIPITFVIIFFFIFSLFFLRSLGSYEKNFIIKTLFIALILRMGISFLYIEVMNRPELTGPDCFGYIRGGYSISNSWKNLDFDKKYHPKYTPRTHTGYQYITASFYLLFGTALSTPAYFNALMGIMIIMILAKLFLEIFAWGIVRFFILSMAFYPSIIIWNSAILKDTSILFLAIVAFYGYFQFMYKRSFNHLVWAILPLFPLFFIRFYITMVILAVYLFSALISFGNFSIKRIFQTMLVALSVMALLLVFGLGGEVSTVMENQANVETLNKHQRNLGIGKTELYEDQHYNNVGDIVKYFPIRLIHFLFSPFPWQIVSVNSALGAVEVPLLWFLGVYFIIGLKFCLLHPKARSFLPIIIYAAFLTALYTIVESNIGTIYRMRYQIIPFYFILSGVGLAVNRAKKLAIDTDFILSERMRKHFS